MTKKEFLQNRLEGLNYIQPKICKECTHNCCEESGCLVLPMDIEPFSVENVIKIINAGRYSIIARIFSESYIQLRLQSREIDSDVFDINKPHTRCALLNETGCPLSREERPVFALSIIPEYGDYCESVIDSHEVEQMWNEKQDIMEEVVKHFSGGKSSIVVIHESFEKTAMRIYKALLKKTPFEHYGLILRNATILGEELYDKIITISNSTCTTDKIITRLVQLEEQRDVKDRNGQMVARKLLQYRPYGLLTKSDASITEKIEACLKFNELYLDGK